MNAVGIDVSKGRSTVAILRPMGEVVMTPEDIFHEADGLGDLADRILSLEGDTKVLMEATGRYHEPVASELHERGIFVSVVNPILIHHYNPDSRAGRNLERCPRRWRPDHLRRWVCV